VVVGGTSLAGGEGKILGTLIGVLIIAVVQNAMNLLEIGSYAQNVVLGLIVLSVVLMDTVKRHGWRKLWQAE
jgi:ribose transport system permease protein